MTSKKTLTIKQSTVLAFLNDFFARHGYPPTVREIARELKMAGPHSAKRFLDMLEAKGYIRKVAKSSRAIEILTNQNLKHTRTVPVVGRVRAGLPLLAQENIEGTLVLDRSLARFKDSFFLRVLGDSMIDAHIKDGDFVLVNPQPNVLNGEIAVVLLNGEEATLKRFFKEGDTIRLIPDNPSMKPIILKAADTEVKIVGKVVALVRTVIG